MPDIKCPCCQKNIQTTGPRTCPECDRHFAGNGWDGIDRHWRTKHADKIPYEVFWKALCPEHRGNRDGKVFCEEEYLEYVKQHGVGNKDKVTSSPDSYVSYLHSVSRILQQSITPEFLCSEEDITRINRLLEGERAPATINNYNSAMRLYADMVKATKEDLVDKGLPAHYFVEQYWPEETRDLDNLYLWFHDKKLKKDAELNDGDRVLFYEVAKHPEKKMIGAKAIFASGTLTSERYYIPTAEQVSGGKRWIFGRRVDTDFAVTPKMGIPLAEAKKVLRISGWPQQGFALEKEQFELLEKELISRAEKSNLAKKPSNPPEAKEQGFTEKELKGMQSSGSLGDAAERTARLEKSHNAHRTILNKLATILTAKGFSTTDNLQVDLFAEKAGPKWIFEVKSTHEGNILAQARHGISQLYEYRYRYRKGSSDIKLCLVLQCPPAGDLAWLLDYIKQDRGIHICWSVPNGFESVNDTDLEFLKLQG